VLLCHFLGILMTLLFVLIVEQHTYYSLYRRWNSREIH
jgi:hypothetical protein